MPYLPLPMHLYLQNRDPCTQDGGRDEYRILNYTIYASRPASHYYFRDSFVTAIVRHGTLGIMYYLLGWYLPQNTEVYVSVEAINKFGSFVTEPRSVCKYVRVEHNMSAYVL